MATSSAELGVFLLRNIWWADNSRIAANRRYKTDERKIPPRTTPVSAPSVVAISSKISSLTFVRRFSIALAAPPQEQAMTETRLAPTAYRMSMPKNNVRAGTTKIPAAIPSIPPSMPAASDIRQPNTENSILFISIRVHYLLFEASDGNASSERGDWRRRKRVESLILSP